MQNLEDCLKACSLGMLEAHAEAHSLACAINTCVHARIMPAGGGQPHEGMQPGVGSTCRSS
eukprot:1161319-Pelagomonas_calceolata.AAC.10